MTLDCDQFPCQVKSHPLGRNHLPRHALLQSSSTTVKRILKLIYIHTLGLMMMMIIISSPSSSLFLTVREEGKRGSCWAKISLSDSPALPPGICVRSTWNVYFRQLCENINILGLLHSQMFTYFAIPPRWYISRKEFALMGLCVSPAFQSSAVNPMQCFCKTCQPHFC